MGGGAAGKRTRHARALATVYGALARGGEFGGVQVLQRETINDMRTEQSNGEDAVLMIASRFGLGFFLELPAYRLTPNATLFRHPGLGGSFGLADPEAKLGIGYAMNKMYLPPDMVSLDPRWVPIFASIYDSLQPNGNDRPESSPPRETVVQLVDDPEKSSKWCADLLGIEPTPHEAPYFKSMNMPTFLPEKLVTLNDPMAISLV